MKFVEVFMMETWVVDVPRARAVVKRDHILGREVSLGGYVVEMVRG